MSLCIPVSHVLQAKNSFQTLDTRDLILIAGFYHVRSEAKAVPHLLVAPKATKQYHALQENGAEENDVDGNDGGYYADGAYTAAPMYSGPVSSSDTVAPDAQDIYYDSLSARFNLLRATLKCTPPLPVIEALDESHPISLPSVSRKAKQHWRGILRTTEPHPVQLACMDSESALEVIKLLKGMMTQTLWSHEEDGIRRFGAWVWAVLGRCPDRTELGSEEIAELRALGKSAVGLLNKMRDRGKKGQGDYQTEVVESEDESPRGEMDDGTASASADGRNLQSVDPSKNGDSSDEQVAAELEEARQRLQWALDSSDVVAKGHADGTENGEIEEGETEMHDPEREVNKQIRTVLDMIITIVGEAYGQRDLLEFRDVWLADGEV